MGRNENEPKKTKPSLPLPTLLFVFLPIYTFLLRALLILESKTYANEAAAWFYKVRNFGGVVRVSYKLLLLLLVTESTVFTTASSSPSSFTSSSSSSSSSYLFNSHTTIFSTLSYTRPGRTIQDLYPIYTMKYQKQDRILHSPYTQYKLTKKDLSHIYIYFSLFRSPSQCHNNT